GWANSSCPSRRAAVPSWSPPTALTRGWAWLIGSPSSRAGASCSIVPPPRSATTSSAGSTMISPSARGSHRDWLRASGVDRGVEGRAERAAKQGEPQHAGLLLGPPPLRIPVRPGAGARAGGDGAAGPLVARLPPRRPPRLRPHLPRGARERLLGRARPLPR